MTDEEPLTPEQRRERALARRQAREQPEHVDEPAQEPQIDPGAFSYGPGPSVPSSRPQRLTGDPTAAFEPADQWYPGMVEPAPKRRRWFLIALLAFFLVPPILDWLRSIGLGNWFIVLCVVALGLYLFLRSGQKLVPPNRFLNGWSILGVAVVITLVVVAIEQPWKSDVPVAKEQTEEPAPAAPIGDMPPHMLGNWSGQLDSGAGIVLLLHDGEAGGLNSAIGEATYLGTDCLENFNLIDVPNSNTVRVQEFPVNAIDECPKHSNVTITSDPGSNLLEINGSMDDGSPFSATLKPQ